MRRIFLFLSLISCSTVFAATRTAVMTGNWFTPATWGGTVPVAADVAVIPAGFTVTLNLSEGPVQNTPWNNPGSIRVFGKMILKGTDPLFSNPCILEVYSGGELNDNTTFGEFLLTPVSMLKVYAGGKYTSLSGHTNILYATNTSIHWQFPVDNLNGPFTITVSGGQINFTASVLPLRLTSFTAKEVGAYNQLNWQTTNEVNTAGFDIERSSDGIHYTSIGTVSATGSAVINYYSFNDPSAPDGTGFYRLKMKDADGRSTYSDVVKLDRSVAGRISIYPSPAKDIIHIITNAEGKMVIFNAEGKLVRSQVLPTGNSIIDISTLSDGIYFIEQAGKRTSFIKATH